MGGVRYPLLNLLLVGNSHLGLRIIVFCFATIAALVLVVSSTVSA